MYLIHCPVRMKMLLLSMLPVALMLFVLPAHAADDGISHGIAQYKDESYEEAAATLQKAYAEHPGNYQVLLYLGMSYMQMLEFEKARTYLQQAAKLQPANNTLNVYLGEAFYNLHNYRTARKVLQKAINSGIESAQAYYFLGLSQYSSGDYQRSLGAFAKAGQLDARMQLKALYLTAMAHWKLGDAKASKAEFRQVIHLAPDSDEAVQAGIMLKRPVPRYYRLSANVGEQYDSNVVLKPANNIAGVTVSRARDYVTTAEVGISFNKVQDNRHGYTASYKFTQTLHRKLSFFDVQAQHAELTPYYKLGKDRAMLALSVDGIGVDYRRYMASFGIMPAYVHDFGDKQHGTFLAGYQRKRFFWAAAGPSDIRDACNYQVGYTYTWGAPQQGGAWPYILPMQGSRLSASYLADLEKAGGRDWSYVGHHVILSGDYPLPHKAGLSLLVDQYRQLYRHVNTFYGIRRHDVTTTIASTLQWQPVPWGVLKLAYSFTRALSSIPIYDYRRNLATFTIGGQL